MSAEQWLAKAETTLVAAELLLERDHRDSAASRTYYACFFITTALVADGGKPFRRHRRVMSQLASRFTQPGLVDRRFHTLLLKAFAARQDADYNVNLTPDAKDVAALILEGREFLAVARAHLESVI